MIVKIFRKLFKICDDSFVVLKITLDDPWDIDIDVHDVSNKHLNNCFLVGIKVRGECGHDLGVIISSASLITFFNLFLLCGEGLIIPSLLYVSELLQVYLGLLLD